MEHAAEPDRLSDLPDCLLQFILSLSSIGARRLVQMSALTRRWRHLWHDARCLDVGHQEFEEAAGDDHENWARFNNFADSLILKHRTLNLDTLRMQVLQPPKDNSWVHRYLAHYSPAVLDIHNDSDGEHVELRGMSDGTVLRRLTTIRLTGVTLCDGFEDLLGVVGCPLLEHLELRDCLIGFEDVVASATLKTLVVDSCNTRMDESPLRLCYTPRIVAPGLASLDLVLLPCYSDLWEFEMPSLVEATVRLSRGWIGHEDFELLCSLHNVTRLEISSFPSLHRVLRCNYDKKDLPEFHNLTTLILDECDFTRDTPTSLDECDVTRDTPKLLEYFLRHAPNLEKLTLRNCKHPTLSERMAEWSKSRKKLGPHLNLKFVEIKQREKDDVCEIIEYLLHVSKNLQRTNILLSGGPEKPWYRIMQR